MERKRCIWCNHEGESLQVVEAAVRNKPWSRRPIRDRFFICSPECRRKFLDYVELYNQYGLIALIVGVLFALALLILVLVAPFVYPDLDLPKVLGMLLMLWGVLTLISPVLEGPESLFPWPILRTPGFRHEGVRRMYLRARIAGLIAILLGLAIFMEWIPLFPKAEPS
jgi:cellulose synthase/poly-beta-1,6-N-acetylglucosamine synthase-like glycosyltransferase